MKQSLTLLFAFLSLSVFAQQAPQGFNYQGVARDANGAGVDDINTGGFLSENTNHQ